jgi:hypothetical protein
VSSPHGAGQKQVVQELEKLIYADDSAKVDAAAQPLQETRVLMLADLSQTLLQGDRYLQQTSKHTHKHINLLLH